MSKEDICTCGCSLIDFLCFNCINADCPLRAVASAIEAQRAETTKIGSVEDESATRRETPK